MTQRDSGLLVSSPGLVRELTADWPPRQLERTDGYRRRPLEHVRPVDAARLGAGTAVAVIDDGSAMAAIPLRHEGRGWSVAGTGEGPSAALVERMRRVPLDAEAAGSGFHVRRFASLPPSPGLERALGADQSNTSVVLDEQVIVKWRTAFEADGLRALTLRRHLAQVDPDAVPPLCGALTWASPDGREGVLADVDGFLPGAEDGWDAFIAELIERTEMPDQDALAIPIALGTAAAGLHRALATPSPLISRPVAQAGRPSLDGWRAAGLTLLERASDIEAEDADVVRARAGALRRGIERLDRIESSPVQPLHGDLHIGQVVRWRDGLAVIDFDGPPGARDPDSTTSSEPFERQPVARDVAQLLCSLDLLAVAVDRRTEGRHSTRLEAWARDARHAFLDAYHDRAAPGLLDERLLSPFLAEQLCRELVYAADVLPRWRYAPIGALRWRYRETTS